MEQPQGFIAKGKEKMVCKQGIGEIGTWHLIMALSC